jgi:uncharacterized membrane-anchored protein YhcB (DUF1043 family)
MTEETWFALASGFVAGFIIGVMFVLACIDAWNRGRR